MEPAGDAPTPGWYADPHDGLVLRWWDGEAWTGIVREITRVAEPGEPRAATIEEPGEAPVADAA